MLLKAALLLSSSSFRLSQLSVRRGHKHCMHDHHVLLLHCTSRRSSTPCIVLSGRLAILTNNMPKYTHYAIVVTLFIVFILHAPTSQAAPVDRNKVKEYATHCNGHKNWNNAAVSTTARASTWAPHCRGQDESPLDDETSPTKLKNLLTITPLEPRKAVINQGFFDWSKAGKVFWAIFAFFSSAVAATFLFWGEIPRLPPGRKILYKPWFKQTRVFAPDTAHPGSPVSPTLSGPSAVSPKGKARALSHSDPPSLAARLDARIDPQDIVDDSAGEGPSARRRGAVWHASGDSTDGNSSTSPQIHHTLPTRLGLLLARRKREDAIAERHVQWAADRPVHPGHLRDIVRGFASMTSDGKCAAFWCHFTELYPCFRPRVDLLICVSRSIHDPLYWWRPTWSGMVQDKGDWDNALRHFSNEYGVSEIRSLRRRVTTNVRLHSIRLFTFFALHWHFSSHSHFALGINKFHQQSSSRLDFVQRWLVSPRSPMYSLLSRFPAQSPSFVSPFLSESVRPVFLLRPSCVHEPSSRTVVPLSHGLLRSLL